MKLWVKKQSQVLKRLNSRKPAGYTRGFTPMKHFERLARSTAMQSLVQSQDTITPGQLILNDRVEKMEIQDWRCDDPWRVIQVK